MPFVHPSDRSRLLEYLRSLAPMQALERGLELASSDAVTDCSRSSHSIYGAVKDGSADDAIPVSLEVLSARSIEAHCSCEDTSLTTSGEQERSAIPQGQWCAHAVALLWRAHELGFLAENGGFSETQGAQRSQVFGANDFALAIRELGSREPSHNPDATYFPQLAVNLDVSTDRLGVQIKFDGEIQEPAIFEGFRRHSARALDNLLLRIVDDEGVWDEEQRRWFVNSSEGIGLVLGLLNEYEAVTLAGTRRNVRFSPDLLNAELSILWTDRGADLSMNWILPNGEHVAREHALIGTGPHWTLVESALHRLSPEASKIAALFPNDALHSIPHAQTGPLLELIQAGIIRGSLVKIVNPKAQPACEQRRPEVNLSLERHDSYLDRAAGANELEIFASLEFSYPVPAPSERLVFLPDRAFEKECHDLLLNAGFEFDRDQRRYRIQGSRALDMAYDGRAALPETWNISGLETLKRGLRFVQSSISVSLQESAGEDGVPSTRSSAKPSRGKIDWFDCHVALVVNNASVPLSTLFKPQASEDDRWIRLDSGAYTRVPGGNIRQLKGMLGMLDPNYKLSNSIKARLSTPLAIGMSRMQGSQFAVSLSPALKNLASRLDDFAGISAVKLSKNFEGKLRPYQQQGVDWLNFLHEYGFGGILADEMGLGKTVQTLAFLQTVKERKVKVTGATARKKKPSLVIAPTSVMMNWRYEAQRFTPKLKVAVLHGTKRRGILQNLSEYDLVITSYALLRVDRFELERQEFDYVILDEAQHIKNYQATTTAAAKALKSAHRLALTGTPTENRPLELWSLFDFLMPGYLGTHDFFRTHIERPILEQGTGIDVARMLRGKTRPFIMRRTKAEVERDLPPKTESTLFVSMTASQRELYAHILDEVRPRVFEAIEEKGIPGASVSILAALLRLRQVCNHPNSIDALKALPGYDSGKFNLLQELLSEALDSGRKVLLFGQFREMLSIIRRHLVEQKIEHTYLDGATRDRQRVIDEFNNNPAVRVFLISLKAGGLGLNLTAADTVIIYDPWWNPAVESQAVDRAHRIGQDKPVHVYRLVTEDSIEQKIMELKRRKTALVEALVNETGISTLALSKGDLESLFAPLKNEDPEPSN